LIASLVASLDAFSVALLLWSAVCIVPAAPVVWYLSKE
jgi:hypothetical protein